MIALRDVLRSVQNCAMHVGSQTKWRASEVVAAKTLTLTGWFGAVTSEILCFISGEGQRGLAHSARALTLHGSPVFSGGNLTDAATELAPRTPVS